MPPGRSQKISLRWVAASFFIVGGGLFLFFWCGALSSSLHGLPPSVVVAVGAVLGGLVAGVASRGRTVIESALGGSLFVAVLCGVYAEKGFAPILWDQQASAGSALYYFGLLTVIGALTGATFGERIARPEWLDKRLLWGVVSFLMSMGGLFFTLLLGFVLTDYFMLYAIDGDAASCMLAIAVAIAAAMATQGMAPIEIPWTAASGTLTSSGLFLVVLSELTDLGQRVLPILAVGVCGVLLARVGAKYIWQRFPPAKPVAEEPIPAARVVD